jgi:hypothetical protein
MKPEIIRQIRKGSTIAYNDGRPGHQGVLAAVLDVNSRGMTVQFEDRADSSYVAFSDRQWMEFIRVVA